MAPRNPETLAPEEHVIAPPEGRVAPADGAVAPEERVAPADGALAPEVASPPRAGATGTERATGTEHATGTERATGTEHATGTERVVSTPERAVLDTSVIPRTRGAVTGFLLLVLGVWGAIVPFIGPYFKYDFINTTAWSFPTYGRLWLSILPGVLAVVAGLMLIGAGRRHWGATAGLLAAIAGFWFVVGQTVSQFWYHGVSQAGTPLGGTFMRTIEQLGYFYVLGGVILFLGALALGRMSAPLVRVRV